MGVGKSTIGKVIAAKSGFDFIDSDDCIAHKAKMSIRDIFATRGESAFRKMESTMISSLAAQNNIILSLGGGTLHHSDNLQKIQKSFTLIVLDAPFAFIKPRIADRPLYPKAESLYNDRIKVFTEIPNHVCVVNRGVDEIAEECIQIWKAAA